MFAISPYLSQQRLDETVMNATDSQSERQAHQVAMREVGSILDAPLDRLGAISDEEWDNADPA